MDWKKCGTKEEISCECSTHGDNKSAYIVLVGNPEGKRPLGKPRVEGRIILKWISEK
jgi:hypothetical protein